MDTDVLSNRELLKSLLGKRAENLPEDHLRALFDEESGEWMCRVARTLCLRLLEEEMRHTAKIDSPLAVQYLQLKLFDASAEYLLALLLNGDMQLLATEDFYRGGLCDKHLYVRHIVEAACEHEARFVVIAHIHPFGNPEPSQEDIHLTKKLQMVFSVLNFTLHDHLIVAGDTIVSMAKRGYLN